LTAALIKTVDVQTSASLKRSTTAELVSLYYRVSVPLVRCGYSTQTISCWLLSTDCEVQQQIPRTSARTQ